MLILEYIKSLLYTKSVQPILNVTISNAMVLHVQFNNYKVSKKLNEELKTFFACIQAINIEKVTKQNQSCIEQPLQYYDILGIVSGDVIRFYNDDVNIFVKFT